jgi:type IV pilus assembly protein PilP
MIRPPVIYIFFLLLPFFLTSCGGEEPQESVIYIKKPAPPPLKPTPKAEEEEKPAAPQADTVVKKDMRNPFQTFIVQRGPLPGPTRIKGPLECCDIGLFRVLAVISGMDEPKALVLAPDGKRYSVKKGDIMGTREGRVIAIRGKSIIVEEKTIDTKGKLISTEKVEIGLPEEEREKR